jgi:hypothetical protein
MYDDKSKQGTTKFTGKVWRKQIEGADADLKVMQARYGYRQLDSVLDQDGDPTENNQAGGAAKLPRK